MREIRPPAKYEELTSLRQRGGAGFGLPLTHRYRSDRPGRAIRETRETRGKNRAYEPALLQTGRAESLTSESQAFKCLLTNCLAT